LSAIFGWRKSYTGTKSLDFGLIAAGAEASLTVTVTGARANDAVVGHAVCEDGRDHRQRRHRHGERHRDRVRAQHNCGRHQSGGEGLSHRGVPTVRAFYHGGC
jgi:hypothetical protein